MTLVLTSELDIAKIHLYTQDEGPSSCGSKVIAKADRQIDRQQKLLKLLPTGTHRRLKFLTLRPWTHRAASGKLHRCHLTLGLMLGNNHHWLVLAADAWHSVWAPLKLDMKTKTFSQLTKRDVRTCHSAYFVQKWQNKEVLVNTNLPCAILKNIQLKVAEFPKLALIHGTLLSLLI